MHILANMIICFLLLIAIAPTSVLALHSCGSFTNTGMFEPFEARDIYGMKTGYKYILHPMQSLTQHATGHDPILIGNYEYTSGMAHDVTHHYTNGDECVLNGVASPRTGTVSFVCGGGNGHEEVIQTIEGPQCTYQMIVASAACCIELPPPPPPPPIRICGSFTNQELLSFTSDNGWNFKFSPFQTVTRSRMDEDTYTYSLGTYDRTEGTAYDVIHHYTNGGDCWGGSIETQVSFVCGDSAHEEITQVTQTTACSHQLVIASASCCTPVPVLSCKTDPRSFLDLQVTSETFNMQINLGNNVLRYTDIDYGKYASTNLMGLVTQTYDNGAVGHTCETEGIPYGHRKTIVHFKCGFSRKIIDVTEEFQCKLFVTLEMPGCCTNSEWNYLQTIYHTTASAIPANTMSTPVDIISSSDVTVPVDVTSSPDVTVPVDIISSTDVMLPFNFSSSSEVTLPVGITSSPDVTVPVDISSAPHVTVNLHLDNKEGRHNDMDSSTNAIVVVVWLVLSMICIFVVIGIVYNQTNETHDYSGGEQPAVNAKKAIPFDKIGI